MSLLNSESKVARVGFTVLLTLALFVTTVSCSPPSSNESELTFATPQPTVEGTTTAQTQKETDLVSLYEQVIAGVVTIEIVRPAETFQLLDTGETVLEQGQGSGFVLDAEHGYIATNNHVVERATEILVSFYDGTKLEATTLGTDPDSDLAIIQIDPDAVDLVALPLADSDQVKVGQQTIAIGNPFGFAGTMTTGIVSALSRTLQLGHTSDAISGQFSIPEMIQTDAAINVGNSGGPLLDSFGAVIGINTAINSTSGTSGGVGFAVPINTLKRVAPSLIAYGEYKYPWLGITGMDLYPAQAESMGLDSTKGAIVLNVAAGSPAEVAGLQPSTDTVEQLGSLFPTGGDVIIALDDTAVNQFDDILIYLTRNALPGDTVELTIIRDGKTIQVPVLLQERPAE